MIIYLAGCPKFTLGINHRLLSFFDNPDLDNNDYSKLFLDSGAFSAWSKGDPINIDDYMEYLEIKKDKIHVYANLDVIGDVKASWKNQKILESNGFTPLPVYHVDDHKKYLKKCIKDYEYFCIGGMARRHNKHTRWEFIRTCFDKIGDNGNKVHGFGVTDIGMLEHFPWYSVDSSSWVLQAATGHIIVPELGNNDLNYNNANLIHLNSLNGFTLRKPTYNKKVVEYLDSLGITIGKSTSKKENPNTYTLKDNEKWFGKNGKITGIVEIIEDYGVSNDFYKRAYVNSQFYKKLETTIKKIRPETLQNKIF